MKTKELAKTVIKAIRQTNEKHRMKLQDIIQQFDPQICYISLYLFLFQRRAQTAKIKKEYWITHFIGLLSQEISEIIDRERDEIMDDYENVKELVLKDTNSLRKFFDSCCKFAKKFPFDVA